MSGCDVTVVVLTFNRVAEVLRTLRHVCGMGEARHVIVVDNASTDGTAAEVRRNFPDVLVIRLTQNIGAAARNVGVAAASTPFVALCDDDTWWAPGSLPAAQHVLEEHPTVALACARVIVAPRGSVDPTSEEMARSPLAASGLPGTAVLGFLAGASVIRRRAFLEAGGFDSRFFLGAEEGLLALDLAVRGWHMRYLSSLLVQHAPSALRDRSARSRLLLRNTIYTAILRLPAAMAIADCFEALSEAARARTFGWVLRQTVSSLPWLLRERRVVPPDIQRSVRAIRRQRAQRMAPSGFPAVWRAARILVLRRVRSRAGRERP